MREIAAVFFPFATLALLALCIWLFRAWQRALDQLDSTEEQVTALEAVLGEKLGGVEFPEIHRHG